MVNFNGFLQNTVSEYGSGYHAKYIFTSQQIYNLLLLCQLSRTLIDWQKIVYSFTNQLSICMSYQAEMTNICCFLAFQCLSVRM